MCSYQMERMFNTTRIPGKDTGTGRGTEPSSQPWAATAGCLCSLPVSTVLRAL